MRPLAPTIHVIATSICFILLLLLATSVAANAQQQCPITGSFNGAITTGDSTATSRLLRDGNASSCGTTKSFPGASANSSIHYDQYSFPNNSGAAACVTVTLAAQTCAGEANQIQAVAYLDSFSPANIQTNYAGDAGVSPATDAPATFEVTVPNGHTLIVVVSEVTAGGGCGSYTLTLGCPATLGSLLISEFRLAGPGANNTGDDRDEFIELYNNTDAPVDVSGYLIESYDPALGVSGNFVQNLPDATVIPARGHFLVGDNGGSTSGTGYTLAASAPLDFDTSTIYDDDFYIHDQGLRLISPGGSIVYDSVGFIGGGNTTVNYVEGTGLPQLGSVPTVQWSWARKISSATGIPVDTNNNANDFALVSVTGQALGTNAVPSVLGAPGAESLASPLRRDNTIKAAYLDPVTCGSCTPNRERVGSGNSGTLAFRRTFTNNTGATVTRLRFRVTDITTLGTPVAVAPQAELRIVNSSNQVVTTSSGTVIVKGTSLEDPSQNAVGGGLNSSVTVALPSGGLVNGDTLNVQFLTNVVMNGRFRFFVNVEGLP